MKIVMIYDQIQAGAGTKDDKMVALNITKEKVGPTVMMEKYLKQIDGNVIATLYCGNGYYAQNKEEVVRKLNMMVTKLGADIVVCGPSFNYLEFSEMCARTATAINKSGIPALCAMSIENEQTILEYKQDIPILCCPKKGGTGLSRTLKEIADVIDKLHNKETVTSEMIY